MRKVNMTAEEFERLAEAYGGAMARWPIEARDAGLAFSVSDPQTARTILAQAEMLDGALDAWTLMPVSHELRERVIASASNPPPSRKSKTWIWGAGFGAGLAAACAAGLVMGVTVSGSFSATSASDEPVSAVMAGYELPAPSSIIGAIT